MSHFAYAMGARIVARSNRSQNDNRDRRRAQNEPATRSTCFLIRRLAKLRDRLGRDRPRTTTQPTAPAGRSIPIRAVRTREPGTYT